MSRTTPPLHDSADTAPAAGLAGLRKMSTTAGVGLGEYRAVNGFAVTSLVLGVASWMSWLHPLLYILPAAAMAFGVVSFLQIRRSNGTQGGLMLAVAGIVLAVVLGGWSLVNDLRHRAEIRQYRGEIATFMRDFGEVLSREDYDAAYAMTHPNFQSEVDLDRFRNTMTRHQASAGGVQGASSNALAQFTFPASGPPTAEAMLIVEMGRGEPLRQPVRLVRTPEGWRLLEFGVWFPRQFQMPVE